MTNHMELFTISKYVACYLKDGQKMSLIPFGDVHRDSKNCHVEKWLEDIASWKARIKKGENLFFIGVGDYTDLYSAHERAELKRAETNMHDTHLYTMENHMQDSIERLYKEIDFMKGRCLGLIEGNHYFVFPSDSTSSTQRLCRMLECKYLGGCGLIRMIVRGGYKNRTGLQTDIFAHHGTGGGGTTASSVRNLEKAQEAFEADIYLMGHDHKKWGDKVDQLAIGGGNFACTLKSVEKVFVRTGSYLRGYVPDNTSYITRKAWRPANLGCVELELTMVRNRKGGNHDTHELKTKIIF